MKTEIFLPAAELKHALPGFTKVISRSSRLPVLQCLRIDRNEQGVIRLHATDLDSFATYQIERSQLGPPAQWLAPFPQFSKAVKESLPTDRLGFLLDSDHCHLRSFIGHVPVDEDITAGAPTDWPPMPHLTGRSAVLESRFKTALPEAFSCVSRDSTRLALQGACLDITQPDMHYVVSTDKRHLYVANSFRFDLAESVILPQRKFLVWQGFLKDGEWRIRVRPTSKEDGAWIELASRHWSFVTKALDGPYPDWRQIEPGESADKTLLIFSQLTTNHLEAVLPRLPSWHLDGQPIKLKVTAEQVFACGRQKAQGHWTEVPIPGVAFSGNPIEVTLNRAYLLKALRFGMRELELSAPDVSPVFRARDRKLVVACYKQDQATPAMPEPEPSEPPSADVPDD
jgi:DNA polymerase III sliding clamp (beta) subunit (PCNA family)